MDRHPDGVSASGASGWALPSSLRSVVSGSDARYCRVLSLHSERGTSEGTCGQEIVFPRVIAASCHRWRIVPEIAILMAMKRVSVAEAKNTLPALLHEAEAEPVEIVRRGKPVAVILSRANYDRLRGKGEGVWAA